LQLDKPGHLDLAGAAIGRPEIEENGFAAQVGEFEVPAVKHGQFEVGSEVADELSLAGGAGGIPAGSANAGE